LVTLVLELLVRNPIARLLAEMAFLVELNNAITEIKMAAQKVVFQI
jgi:hypothetical protein